MDQKIVEQKKLLVKLRQEFENTSKPSGQTWNEHEIQQLLRSLPEAIFRQGNNVTATMVQMKTAELNLKKVHSQLSLQANYDPELKAAGDRKAFVENHIDYQKAEEEVIIAKGNYKAAELHYAAYESLFTAVKKAASIVTDQNFGQSSNS